MKNRFGLQGAYRLLTIQLFVSVLAAILAFIWIGLNGAVSALLGGLVSALPNAFFAKKLFQYHGARAARQIVNSFYVGEALKIFFSIVLFIVVFTCCHVIPWLFFVVYVGVQLLIWLAPIIFVNRKVK